MLPYHEAGNRLEKLLEKLFDDDDESITEDLVVLERPGPKPRGNCCLYSYGGYGG